MLSPRRLTGSLPRDRHLVRKRTRTGQLFCLTDTAAALRTSANRRSTVGAWTLQPR